MTQQLINKELVKGTLSYLTFRVRGDHSNRKLYYLAKETESSVYRMIYKRNALAGGSNVQISSNYTGPHTDITVRVEHSDSETLNIGYYVHTLISIAANDVTDVDSLAAGQLNVLPNVQQPIDVTYDTSSEYTDQAYDKILIAEVLTDGNIVIGKDIGFNAILTRTGLGTGVCKLISPQSMFTSDLDIDIKAINLTDLNALMVFNNDLGTSALELKIGCYDINSAMVLDVDFLLTIKRKRS